MESPKVSRFHQGCGRLQLHFSRRRRGDGPPPRFAPIPIPGVGRITLGLAGVLLVALVLGHVRRTGIVWTLPLSANMVLRNFGLTVFLAQVGISSGPQFAATVAESGFTLLLLGAVIMVALILVTMIAGRLPGIPADDLFGIVSGVTGIPPSSSTPTEPSRRSGPTSATRWCFRR